MYYLSILLILLYPLQAQNHDPSPDQGMSVDIEKERAKIWAFAREQQKKAQEVAKNTWFKVNISGDFNATFTKQARYIKLECKTKGLEKILLLDTGRGVKHQFKLGIPYDAYQVGKLPLSDLTNKGNIAPNTASIAYIYMGMIKHSPLQSLTRKYSKNLNGYLTITNIPKKEGEYFKGEILTDASIKGLPGKTVKAEVSFSLPLTGKQIKSCIP